MKRHCKSKHAIEPCTLLFALNLGIYMVKKSEHGGVGYPIHVQKIVNANQGWIIDFEVESC